MASIKSRDLLAGSLLLVFLILCFYFQQKGRTGPWHNTAVSLWQKEEWGKLQALGDNLFRVGKEDAESYYLAMLASQQTQNAGKARLFAERLSATRVLNLKMELQTANLYQPDTLRKRIALFRTRIIYSDLLLLTLLLAVSVMRKDPYRAAPALLSIFGMIVLLL
jgi:hypothetical protein